MKLIKLYLVWQMLFFCGVDAQDIAIWRSKSHPKIEFDGENIKMSVVHSEDSSIISINGKEFELPRGLFVHSYKVNSLQEIVGFILVKYEKSTNYYHSVLYGKKKEGDWVFSYKMSKDTLTKKFKKRTYVVKINNLAKKGSSIVLKQTVVGLYGRLHERIEYWDIEKEKKVLEK